ncbi:MAG: alcohol dehydrogenase catalytic domain-containing protein [Spirochaetota bacterium]
MTDSRSGKSTTASIRGLFVLEKSSLGFLSFPEPEPGPYQALVRVAACGICNSTDWKIIQGRSKQGPFPILLGHESAGVVVKAGSRVRSFSEGDLVLRARLEDSDVASTGGCSRFGGFSQGALVTDVWAEQGVGYNAFAHPQQKVPPCIAPREAPVLITLKETLYTLKAAGAAHRRSLAIVGTGPAAQMMTALAKILGISPVFVFGRRERWGGLFSRLGADGYAWVERVPEDARRILREGGFDLSVEAVGSSPALRTCLSVTGPGGRVAVYGMPADDEPYESQLIKDPRVMQLKVREGEVHEELLGYLERGELTLSEWVDRVLPWDRFQEGFELVREKQARKVVLTVHPPTEGQEKRS